MKKKQKDILLLLIFTLCFTNTKNILAQENKLLRDCEIISIETISFLPQYYVITSDSEIGKITMFSKKSNQELENKRKKRIKKNRKYDFRVTVLDSTLIHTKDTSVYFDFCENRVRKSEFGWGVEGTDDFIFFTYENCKPFLIENTDGIYYIELKKN